jgi:hypothetical protein
MFVEGKKCAVAERITLLILAALSSLEDVAVPLERQNCLPSEPKIRSIMVPARLPKAELLTNFVRLGEILHDGNLMLLYKGQMMEIL